MSTLTVQSHQHDTALVARLIGSADVMNDGVLAREVDRLIAGKHSLVVLDLSQLTFMASMAVGQLVSLYRAMKVWGGQMRIAAPSESVRQVLTRCKLTDIMPLHAGVDEAVRAPITPRAPSPKR